MRIILFGLLLLCAFSASAAYAAGPIHVVELEGSINPGSARFILNHISEAAKDRAQALIIELDTPGGLETAMRSIVKGILNSPIPIIVYVSPSGARAASAGVMITISAHVAAMAPGTNIGAAHPVGLGGKDIDKTMSLKAENDLVAFSRSIAEKRGRNADWVENAVRRSVSITESEALDMGVVDIIAQDVDELLEKLNGRKVQTSSGILKLDSRKAELIRLDESIGDKVLRIIGDPNIAYILMMIGLAGLYFELANPGAVFPGVIGAICLILAFFSFQTLPVNYTGLLLIMLSAVFFLLEIKVTSYGLLGLAGIAVLILGSLMLFNSGSTNLRPAWTVLISMVFTISAFFITIAVLAIRATKTRYRTGAAGLIGETGTVKEWAGNRGRVFVHGEYWNAISDDILGIGSEVEVVSIDRLLLKVKKARSAQ